MHKIKTLDIEFDTVVILLAFLVKNFIIFKIILTHGYSIPILSVLKNFLKS